MVLQYYGCKGILAPLSEDEVNIGVTYGWNDCPGAVDCYLS